MCRVAAGDIPPPYDADRCTNHVTPESDTYFPNLDQDPDWYPAEVLRKGEENGIGYEMVLYLRK